MDQERTPAPKVAPHSGKLPLRVGTRGSPLARRQTELFLAELRAVCPALGYAPEAFAPEIISTTGDRVQDRRLAEIGGKGLFAKEIHEALLARRIDFAVHSLKDLETTLPEGIILACTMKREDARDALILAIRHDIVDRADRGAADIWAALPARARIGTSSVRRQAQLLHARPDLRISLLRGNVRTRLDATRNGTLDGTLLALAGLRRLGFEHEIAAALDPEAMVPSAGQGIVGITVRAEDHALGDLLAAIEDPEAKAVSTAERALLAALDGSCRTPIGGHARLLPDGTLHLTGLTARADGSFLLKRSEIAPVSDAARLGTELGASLRRDSPADIFLD
ncbi:hydroxymethylbilane synthase [Acidiphilium sp. AL]|uniref:Porphobilinogen deaminase n=1 Tax=Acidiphilium iwatense TaxID=768198 RepID=A0ABS9DRJ7_9PROT|nr:MULTISPECIES: hydroxymethylbilane synthase [Acidiphilium]MCF3945381.1 hydroxymethylbilane synthase [Acidiphilium iwatense]MCU4158897.1 hydroxymethylbilane synthase [Acidiphilium sp. AL]